MIAARDNTNDFKTLPAHVRKNEISAVCYEKWQNWNQKNIAELSHHVPISASISFTPLYFHDDDSRKLLNKECRSIVNLGIGAGLDVMGLGSDWQVIGYEYSVNAVNFLKNKKNFTIREIDLESLDETQTKLAYDAQLAEDLSKVTNIVAANILQYLDDPSMTVLLLACIRLAQPGTVFFIANSVYTSDDKLEMKKQRDRKIRGFLEAKTIELFCSRHPNMELQHKSRVKEYPQIYKDQLGFSNCDVYEELLVYKKTNNFFKPAETKEISDISTLITRLLQRQTQKPKFKLPDSLINEAIEVSDYKKAAAIVLAAHSGFISAVKSFKDRVLMGKLIVILASLDENKPDESVLRQALGNVIPKEKCVEWIANAISLASSATVSEKLKEMKKDIEGYIETNQLFKQLNIACGSHAAKKIR